MPLQHHTLIVQLLQNDVFVVNFSKFEPLMESLKKIHDQSSNWFNIGFSVKIGRELSVWKARTYFTNDSFQVCRDEVSHEEWMVSMGRNRVLEAQSQY